MLSTYNAITSFLPAELRNREMRPYILPLTTTTALAAAGSTELTTPLQNVAAFLLTGITGRVYTTGAPETSIADPALTIQVRFSSGDDLTFGAVPWSSLVNDAGSPNGHPFGLVVPRLVAGGSNISLTLTNYSGVANYNVRLGLQGVNIYSAS